MLVMKEEVEGSKLLILKIPLLMFASDVKKISFLRSNNQSSHQKSSEILMRRNKEDLRLFKDQFELIVIVI